MPLSSEKIRPFLSTLPAVLYEYLQHQDGSGEIIYMSPNSKEILGYPPEYFIEDKECRWEFIHPEDLSKFRLEDTKTVNDPYFSISIRIIVPSKEIRWVRFRSKPEIKKYNGDVVWAGCIVDITDLKEAREEIKLLQGIIPICSYCNQIRDEEGSWSRLENYIESHSEAQFSHGICDKCMSDKFGMNNQRKKKEF